MVQLAIKHDIANTIRLLNDRVRRQVPFATSKALNETAKLVQSQVVAELKSRLDRPTPFVLKSIFIKYSNKQNLRAEVYLRNTQIGGKNPNSLAEILNQQFSGGTRIRTRLEGALTRAGLISSNEYVAPGAGAKLDAYGNMSRGQIQQLLSQLFASPNPEANRTGSSRSKSSVKRAGRIFWSRGNHLPRGAWIEGSGGLRPLLLVVSRPNYRRRIDMEAIAVRVSSKNFDRIFQVEFEKAVRTAR
jgi:ribosome biogenesis protein Nip4